ncbi:hypothetical protein L3V83_11315 [Thiotrichales bacterium 19X7-9]|nr:hypothetical protein [Thiotrichales bacterium 19X7-9]
MKNVIPLWCWLVTVIFVTVTTIFSLCFQPSDYFNWGLDRLKSNQDNTIVAIGTSLTRHGFYFDQTFDLFSKNKNLNIRFIRFTKSGGKPQDFDRLLSMIEKKSTYIKILFIQLEPYMLHNSKSNQVLYTMQFHLHKLINNILHKFRTQQDYETDSKLNLAPSSSYSKIKSLFKNRNHTKVLKSPYLLTKEMKLLKKIQHSGTKIIFLRINYATETYQVLLPNNLNQQIQQWISQFQKNTGYPVWQFPSLNASYYTDTAHLNYKGRKLFSTWVISKIKSEELV